MNARHVRIWKKVIVASIGAIAVSIGILWWLLRVGPMDFAGTDHVTLAAYQGVNPTGVPASLASASQIDRGRYLTQAADCVACHTIESGEPFAGGRAFKLPVGTIYSTNITPDRKTGIGEYTDKQFQDAVRRGVRRDGQRLYPAMPYPSYTLMTDDDADAIKAYLFSLKPVASAARPNALIFPANKRWVMAGWSMFFASDHRFEPHANRSAEWNRGAYLAEALAHCGECHTPRTPLVQSLYNRSKFTGAELAGWRAYNITIDGRTGIGEWSNGELEQYLGVGHATGRGTASGPMGEAVDNSLRYLTKADVGALVLYLRTVPARTTDALPHPREQAASASYRSPLDGNLLGRRVYAEACLGCHGWSGRSPLSELATLTQSRATNDPAGLNVAQVVVFGSGRQADSAGMAMPAFGNAYSDEEIAAVANYVTQRFGAQGSQLLGTDVAKLRQSR